MEWTLKNQLATAECNLTPPWVWDLASLSLLGGSRTRAILPHKRNNNLGQTQINVCDLKNISSPLNLEETHKAVIIRAGADKEVTWATTDWQHWSHHLISWPGHQGVISSITDQFLSYCFYCYSNQWRNKRSNRIFFDWYGIAFLQWTISRCY